MEDVASESDVVFVLTPGGQETKNLVDEKFLRRMKKTAVLVNTSRGSVVDSDALAKALREGWIWAAGLDVVEGEPNIHADHPLIQEPRLNFLMFRKMHFIHIIFLKVRDAAAYRKRHATDTPGYGCIGCKERICCDLWF